jgi:hypothetical protein
MDDFKSEKWTLDDGRRAERRVMENKMENGQCEKVIELHIEDERPLRLQQRVVEKSKPIVFERRIETVDPQNGSVVEQKVESIEPKVQMQLVEHISTSSSVSAQAVPDRHVTREEMIDSIVAAIKATRESQSVQSQSVPSGSDFAGKLNSLGLADEIAGRVQSGMSTKDMLLMGIIAAQVLGLVYILFFM